MLNWRKILVLTHRWLGILGCLLFIAWFVSGIVMMYARMPDFADVERLVHSDPLDLSKATLSPGEVIAASEFSTDRVQVTMVAGRPAYRLWSGGEFLTVFADTGDFFLGVDADGARVVAQRAGPGGRPLYAGYLEEPDQWTLQSTGEMPFHVFRFDDANDTRVYVSEARGETSVRTTRRERFWAYLGPVTHWLYFTPFRRNGSVWSEFIIWSSLIGCGMCILGLVWGVLRYSPIRRYRLRGTRVASPYTNWMKWHHYAGLLFGVVTFTWTYSGLLSMGPFNWFASPGLTMSDREAATHGFLDGSTLTLDGLRAALATFQRTFDVKELNAVRFQGESYWAADRIPADARNWRGSSLLPRASRPRLERHYVSVRAPERAFTEFSRDAFPDIARKALPGVPVVDQTWLDDYDGYYYDLARARQLPVLRVRFADADETWLYLDPRRGAVVQKSTSTSRLRRWLYQGFHSLDFPFLYYQRPLWDVVVIGLSLGGLALSVTTLLPAWRRLRRHARVIGTGLGSRVRARFRSRSIPAPTVGDRC
ncbi:MAG: PepSY domain-containing protein [Vicinamibacterales bacterium]